MKTPKLFSKECSLTNTRARTLYNAIYKKRRLTVHQMIVVRKAFAYAFELSGGTPGGNFPAVKEIWKLVQSSQCADRKHKVLPDRIPTMTQLKKAFTTEWKPKGKTTLVAHMLGCVAAYDWGCFGMRSNEDMSRVKKSRNHHADWERGWQATEFQGGRAKLHGVKKGSRPWRVWTVCFCPGKKHQRPSKRFYVSIQRTGNPRGKVNFCTTCPLACLEVLFAKQPSSQKRRYPKWLDSGRFGEKNVNDVAAMAIQWFIDQGAISEAQRFCRNAGRKSLAVWTGHLNVPYEESFQIHGDLWNVWSKNYEKDVQKSGFRTRTQTTTPLIATKALRKLANYFGRGRKVKRKLCPSERMQSEVFLLTHNRCTLFLWNYDWLPVLYIVFWVAVPVIDFNATI